MDETDIVKPKPTDKGAQIIITQAICVAIILLSVVVIKYFFEDCYSDIKDWYNENICVETSVSEVMESFDGGSNET